MIEPDKARQFGIETEAFLRELFSEVVKVSGQIEPASTDRVAVTARRGGIFTLSAEITAGMDVSAGTVIKHYIIKRSAGRRRQRSSQSHSRCRKKELERLTPLYKDGLVTASTYNEAERAYKEASRELRDCFARIGGRDNARKAGVITDILSPPDNM